MDPRFEQWFLATGVDPATVRTHTSGLKRVEVAYGDLDHRYDDDRLRSLLDELVYSKNDARVDAPNPSRISISGDVYNGLASLRSHLTRYAEFRDAFSSEASGLASEASPPESDGPKDLATFSMERDLQVALRQSIDQLEKGLAIVDGGREHVVPSGKIDILAEDSEGNRVVIELKAVTAGRDAVAQTLAYMGDLDAEEAATIRGIWWPRSSITERALRREWFQRCGSSHTASTFYLNRPRERSYSESRVAFDTRLRYSRWPCSAEALTDMPL